MGGFCFYKDTVFIEAVQGDEFPQARQIKTIEAARLDKRRIKLAGFTVVDEQEAVVPAKVAGRFLSVDPIAASYPELTPYQFAGNMPIYAIDLDGLEPAPGEKNYGKYIVFGSKQQYDILNPLKRDLSNKNWIGYRGKSLQEIKLKLQDHKGVAKMVYLQSHGETGGGRMFILENPASANPDISVVDFLSDSYLRNSVTSSEIDYYLELQAQADKGDSEALHQIAENVMFGAVKNLREITQMIEEGGTLILGACASCLGDDGEALMMSIQKLSGNRLNIYMPQDFVANMVPIKGATVFDKSANKNRQLYKDTFLDQPRSSTFFAKGWKYLGRNDKKPTETGMDLKLNSRGDAVESMPGQKK